MLKRSLGLAAALSAAMFLSGAECVAGGATYSADMFPDLVVPPVTDTGQHGVAEITFNNDDTAATVRVETNLKGSDITNVYLRFGGPGENGLVLFSLNAGNLSTFSTTIHPEDIVDYGTGYNWDSFRASLKRQEIYILIQTNQVLDGELRGDFR